MKKSNHKAKNIFLETNELSSGYLYSILYSKVIAE